MPGGKSRAVRPARAALIPKSVKYVQRISAQLRAFQSATAQNNKPQTAAKVEGLPAGSTLAFIQRSVVVLACGIPGRAGTQHGLRTLFLCSMRTFPREAITPQFKPRRVLSS